MAQAPGSGCWGASPATFATRPLSCLPGVQTAVAEQTCAWGLSRSVAARFFASSSGMPSRLTRALRSPSATVSDARDKQQPDTKRACHGMPTPSMLVEATCVLGEGSRQAGSGEGRGRHGPYAARNRTCGARRALVNSIAKSCVTRPQPATGVAFLLRLGCDGRPHRRRACW